MIFLDLDCQYLTKSPSKFDQSSLVIRSLASQQIASLSSTLNPSLASFATRVP